MSPIPPPDEREPTADSSGREAATSAAQDPSDAAEPSRDPGTADDALGEQAEAEERRDVDEPAEEDGSTQTDAWQAVWSAEANAWYFWNAETNETTWQNPRADSAVASSSSTLAAAPSSVTTTEEADALPGIDPELAWLDPTAARASFSGGLAQAARFNARTGRFMADPSLNPDRISEYQRGRRQQEAYYDVAGWEASLASRPPKREHEDVEQEDGKKKRPSAKQVEKFRQAKEEKKRKKLTSWLGS